MTVINCNTRALIHKAKDGSVVRFSPHGEMYEIHEGKLLDESARAGRVARTVEKSGSGHDQLAARIFLGLSVDKKPTYSIEDVVKAVEEIRAEQGEAPDASILLQRGIYSQEGIAQPVEEDSVQIIVLEFKHDEEKFTLLMSDLADKLRTRFKQKEVYLEIQKGGLSRGVYRAFG